MANFIWDPNGVNIVSPSQDMIDDGFPEDYDIKSGEMNWILNQVTTARIQVGEQRIFSGAKSAIDIDAGFLPLFGESLCKSNTGATYADDRYQDLYIFCWESYSDSICPVAGGRGASALADWTAQKFLTLPNRTGTTCVGYSPVTSSAFNVPVGTIVGSETVTLNENELPVITPTATSTPHDHLFNISQPGGGSQDAADEATGRIVTQDNTFMTTVQITVAPFGGGLPHNNIQPSAIVNFMIKW